MEVENAMPRMSLTELRQALDEALLTKFIRVFALKELIERSLLPTSYEPSSRLAEAISLTPAGEQWDSYLIKTIPELTADERRVAIFGRFYWQDLFIDLERTNENELASAMSDEIKEQQILYPWIFGRTLSDRAKSLFGDWTTDLRNLGFSEVSRLLEDSPQGVFQLSNFVTGPFGLLKSKASRYFPPDRDVRMLCADPGCLTFHGLFLMPGECPVNRGYDAIYADLVGRRTHGLPSAWDVLFAQTVNQHDERRYDDLDTRTLPLLLANGFSEPELRMIVGSVLQVPASGLGELLPRSGKTEKLFLGSIEEITSRLNKAQCLQLLLLVEDEHIICGAEVAIKDELVRIPQSEVRTTVWSPPVYNYFNVRCRASSLGIGFRSPTNSLPLRRLKSFVRSIYANQQDFHDLEWKLRHLAGDSLDERLETFVRTQEPQDVLEELVFSSRERVLQSFSLLKWGDFTVPTNNLEEARLVATILWKLGFRVRSYPTYLDTFWQRYDNFLQTSRKFTRYGDPEREEIRGAGSNFFVSLEEILENSLAFSTFALLYDHYTADYFNRFKCSFHRARAFMSDQLSGRSLGHGQVLRLDPNGKNTLYPLIHGFGILAAICTERKANPEAYERPPDQFPAYEGKTSLLTMPFRHIIPLLDLRQEDSDRLVRLFLEVTQVLDGAKVSKVRNTLQHKQEDFPSAQEIEVACMAISKMIGTMEVAGVCPNVYQVSSSKEDAFDRGVTTMTDYRGRRVDLPLPSAFGQLGLPSSRTMQFVMPWARIGDSSELMRLAFQEESDYTQMWGDFLQAATGPQGR